MRIEDTDRKRFTQGAVDAILESMTWLGLNWDGDVIYQFSRAAHHKEKAEELLAEGKAYHCYCSPEELQEMRHKARAEKRPPGYDGRWRDRDPRDAPAGIKPVVRLKTPLQGSTTLVDDVQGEVTVQNDQLDDLILLRADGTPTYMLSVVVDDHDMGVTHIMRGDDHLTNSFRQKQIYEAFGWTMPELCHIPLIHGADGAKLSKRHGALGVEAYKERGILPDALCNYLLRLGWSHGDDEKISRQQAIEWFTPKNIGKSPARFDMDKLLNLNGHYIRSHDNGALLILVQPLVEKLLGRDLQDFEQERLTKGMDGLKERAKDLNDLAHSALIYADIIPYEFEEKAKKFVDGQDAKELLRAMHKVLDSLSPWEEKSVEAALRTLADSLELKFGKIAQPLRASLTGRTISPGIFEIMSTLGQKETLDRLEFVISL